MLKVEHVNQFDRNEYILNRHLAIRPLKQWARGSWNSPRNLTESLGQVSQKLFSAGEIANLETMLGQWCAVPHLDQDWTYNLTSGSKDRFMGLPDFFGLFPNVVATLNKSPFSIF